MSRVAKAPVELPSGVEVKLEWSEYRYQRR